jgi:hypothetical protein
MSKFSDHLDMKVNLPEINTDKILIPEMFITQEDYLPTGKTIINKKGEKVAEYKKGWTIAQNVKGNKSINKTRQISSRDKHPVLNLRTAKVGSVQESPHFIPRLADFPKPEDRYEIFKYLTHLHPSEEHEYPENLSRGFPPILPKNWRRKKLGEYPKDYTPPYDSDEEEEKFVNLFNEELKENAKARTKKSKTLHEDIFGSDTESEEEGKGVKKRGRPRKHKTQEDSYKAKIKSNKDKRAERRLEERRNKIKVKLEKGEKLTKKEKELHEVEGEGIDFQDIKWGTFKALYDRFIKKNPQFKEHIEDLPHFADFVLENKDKFSKVAEKKALFMKNILENHK